ncbi:hypothetical protein QR680_016679 [Steinernema hermaphroditum]|uniref:Uncharacterized protein n=1 Tax=Steinernema hermaphroditum TaxID=289476 RepID=A0AA39HBY4_9BILA|nr:hypothetical protein QR680_016679 [Steinernema hermaphroditum]
MNTMTKLEEIHSKIAKSLQGDDVVEVVRASEPFLANLRQKKGDPNAVLQLFEIAGAEPSKMDEFHVALIYETADFIRMLTEGAWTKKVLSKKFALELLQPFVTVVGNLFRELDDQVNYCNTQEAELEKARTESNKGLKQWIEENKQAQNKRVVELEATVKQNEKVVERLEQKLAVLQKELEAAQESRQENAARTEDGGDEQVGALNAELEKRQKEAQEARAEVSTMKKHMNRVQAIHAKRMASNQAAIDNLTTKLAKNESHYKKELDSKSDALRKTEEEVRSQEKRSELCKRKLMHRIYQLEAQQQRPPHRKREHHRSGSNDDDRRTYIPHKIHKQI